MKIWLYSVDLNMLIIYYILNLFLSEQLTINKFTLLDCTNTEIHTYCVNLQYTPLVRYPYTHSFGTDEVYSLLAKWQMYRFTHKGLDCKDNLTLKI